MSESKYSKPYFLGDSVAETELEAENWGVVTEPRFLEGSLSNIKERIPDFDAKHYIIKQYKDSLRPLFSEEDIQSFEQDENGPNLSTKEVEKLTLVDQYLILKRRQDELKRYAGPAVANMVVDSHFFIAKSDTGMHLYEIQKRLPPYTPLFDADNTLFKTMTPEARTNFKERAIVLVEVLTKLLNEQDDPYFKIFIPDLSRFNIGVIRETGEIKLFDTNFNSRDAAYDSRQYTKGPSADHGRSRLRRSIETLEALSKNILW
jgi:hypothetical protein